MPVPVQEVTAKVDEYARSGAISGSGSTLFEELGLYYIGTVDGHNLEDLVAILQEVKATRSVGPVLIHIVTEKGRGYSYAEGAQDKYHGVSRFDVATGKQKKAVGERFRRTRRRSRMRWSMRRARTRRSWLCTRRWAEALA